MGERQRQETERILRESLERSQAVADCRAAESSADFDRRMAESKAETDRRAADFDRRMAESKAEADRRAAEAEARLARAEAIAAQANQAVNSLSSPWGEFVENLVDLGGNRATISKSGTQTRGLSPLFLKPFVYW